MASSPSGPCHSHAVAFLLGLSMAQRSCWVFPRTAGQAAAGEDVWTFLPGMGKSTWEGASLVKRKGDLGVDCPSSEEESRPVTWISSPGLEQLPEQREL